MRGSTLVCSALFFGTVHCCGRSNNRRDSPIRRHLLSLNDRNEINQQLFYKTQKYQKGKNTNLAILSIVGVYLVIMYAGLGRGDGGWGDGGVGGAPNLGIISWSLESAPQWTTNKD